MLHTSDMIDISLDRRGIPDAYREAKRRLIIVDYDGVLVPTQREASLTLPSRETKAVVQLLADETRNSFLLLSNRDRQHLDLHWSGIDGIVVAEFGALYRDRGREWRTLFGIDDSWMDAVSTVFAGLPSQYAGSYLERRVHSMTWHYMNLPGKSTESDINRIVAALRALPLSKEFEVYQGHNQLELGPRGVDPGSFLARWIGGQKFDFVIAIGGDRMNETVFRILTDEAVTVSVNPAMTRTAKYWLRQQSDVLGFLKSLLATDHHFSR